MNISTFTPVDADEIDVFDSGHSNTELYFSDGEILPPPLWHSDLCFVELYPWSYPHKIQPDGMHKSFAMSALDVIQDMLADKVDNISMLTMKSIGRRLKIAIAGKGFDIYHPKKGDAISIELRGMLQRIEDISDEQELGGFEHDKLPVAPHLAIEIINKDSMHVLSELPGTADSDSKPRLQKLFEKVFKEYSAKPLALIPDDTSFLDMIEADFPNFAEFCYHLKSQFALSKLGNGALRLQPVLLVGEPGIGKTEILRRVASFIQTEFKSISMSSAQSGSNLAGSDIFWANSRQGSLFDLLVFGKTANPIIMLDELDKTTQLSANSPVGALYELLERRAALTFEDKALPGVKIDASHVVWIASCNDTSMIEPALLSRFRIFKITAPHRDHVSSVIHSIYADLLHNESWGMSFSAEIAQDVEEALSVLSPRDIRKTLESACAAAAMDGRSWIAVTDIRKDAKKMRVGF